MSQENETEIDLESASALTETAAIRASLVTRTFLTFDAFEDFLLELLTDEFGNAEAHGVYCNAKMAGLFNHYYDNPELWNDVQGMALRNLICFSRAQSTAFLADLFEEFFRQTLPHSAVDSAVGDADAEVTR